MGRDFIHLCFAKGGIGQDDTDGGIARGKGMGCQLIIHVIHGFLAVAKRILFMDGHTGNPAFRSDDHIHRPGH